MDKAMTEIKSLEVPFYGNNLVLVDVDGEPYVAMKPIVEGMGMDWAGQFTKLKSNPKRWGIEIISIPSKSGDQQAICLPLRKTAAWLMTISPNKVKPEIREKIIQYQNECDEVLWKYWNAGAVINPRVQESDLKKVVRQALAEYSRATAPAPDPEIERGRMRLEMMKFQADKAMKLKEMAFDLQSRGIFDIRYVRRVVEHSVSLLTGEVPSPKVMVDLSSWLESHGISASGGNAMQFGRFVAEVYRKVRGREPGKRPMLIRGREILANYYQEPDDLPVLEEALAIFRKTIKTPTLIPFFGGKTL